MKTDFSKHKITFDLEDIVNQFDCIAGVAYQDKDAENQLLVPTVTMPKCDFVDCTVYDKKTLKCLQNLPMPFSTEQLGKPIGFFPPEEKASIVPVKDWDAYSLVDVSPNTHAFEIDDRRAIKGQAFVTISTIDGSLDDMLSVTMEVNSNPLNEDDKVPCAHVHFDDNQVAFSLFKVGDRILMRPENGVEITTETSFVNGYGEQVTWFK